MSNREYFDLCDNNPDTFMESLLNRGTELKLEEQERQQKEDPDYPMISIDYSQKSWEQFTTDLNNPKSQLREDLAVILAEGDLR